MKLALQTAKSKSLFCLFQASLKLETGHQMENENKEYRRSLVERMSTATSNGLTLQNRVGPK